MRYNLEVVILQESNNKKLVHNQLIRSRTGREWLEWCALPAIGTSKGIIVAWKSSAVQMEEELIINFAGSISKRLCEGVHMDAIRCIWARGHLFKIGILGRTSGY